MKLTVIGPTGATGEQIVRQVLASGYEVTTVARRPEAVALTDPHLRVVRGDVLDPASLGEGIVGADAVLSALGSRQANRPTTVYSTGTAAVLDLRSGGMASSFPPSRHLLFRTSPHYQYRHQSRGELGCL